MRFALGNRLLAARAGGMLWRREKLAVCDGYGQRADALPKVREAHAGVSSISRSTLEAGEDRRARPGRSTTRSDSAGHDRPRLPQTINNDRSPKDVVDGKTRSTGTSC